jgi:hypothetical protein
MKQKKYLKKCLVVEGSSKGLDRIFRLKEHGWKIFDNERSKSGIYSLARSLDATFVDSLVVSILKEKFNKDGNWDRLFKDAHLKVLYPTYPIRKNSRFYKQMMSFNKS